MNKKITVETLYDRLAIFFFSTVILIIFSILGTLSLTRPELKYPAIGCFALFFIGYGFLIGEFLETYLRRTFNFFKTNYSKYRYIYWILFAIALMAILILAGVILLGKQKTIEIGISTGLVGALALFSYGLKKSYEKRKKRKE